MATKGVANVETISLTTGTPGEFAASGKYLGLNGDFANGNFTIEDISADLSQLLFESAIKTAIKKLLIDNHGYTFGLFDTIRVMGATL